MSVAPFRYRIIVSSTATSPRGTVNVFNVANTAALSDTQVNTLLTNIKTFFTALTTYVQGTQTYGTRILEYTAGVPAPRIVSVTPQVGGATGGTLLPPQLAATVSLRTALAGRSYRGRLFLGPLVTGAVTGPALATAFVTATLPAAATLISALRTSTNAAWGWVVHSNKTGNDTPVSSVGMDTRVDTMRSRS